MRYLLFISFFTLGNTCLSCFAQDADQLEMEREVIHEITLKKDLPIASVALGLTMTHFLMKKDQTVSLEYIMNLDTDEGVNDFDESAIENFSPKADKASDVFMYTAMAAPALLMFDREMRKDWKEITLMSTETYLIGLGLVSLSKNLVNRARPLAYNTNLTLEQRAEYGTTNSFMSGHTAATAMASFMMASIILDYHPDTPLKPLIWTLASGIPLATGMLRYTAGKHYFTDIFAGYAVGAITGYFVPHIHQKIKTKRLERHLEIVELFEH